MENVACFGPSVPGSILSIPLIFFSPKIFSLDVAEIIDGTAKNSGQRLDIVNRTHLVLASDKRVLQKIMGKSILASTGNQQPQNVTVWAPEE